MIFKGKYSAVILDSLVAVGRNGSGIVTIHENGMRNQTNYTSAEEFQEDFNRLTNAFAEAQDDKSIFTNAFGVTLVGSIVELGIADSSKPGEQPDIGIYFTFRSGVREYYKYADVESRDKDYNRLTGLMSGLSVV